MRRGFTLLELSIVLVLIAVIIGGGLMIFTSSLQASQVNVTVARMDAIEKALLNFSIANYRIPCPSDLTQTATSSTYGLEAGAGSGSAISTGTGVCTGVGMLPQANFKAASGTVEGGVPTRALKLPDEYMYDGWGRRLRYSVDPTYTASVTLPVTTSCSVTQSANATAITIKDATGATRSASAAYALISHGGNGHGAYTSNGVTTNAASTNADELTNCHCDSSAAATVYTPSYVQKNPTLDSASSLNNFDDIVAYKDAWQLQAPDQPLTVASCPEYIYVTDQVNCNVQKFDSSGNFLLKFGTVGTGDGQFTCSSGGLQGIAVDSSQNVWVSDTGNARVQKFDSNGNFLSKFGTSGSGAGQFTANGFITIDSTGNLWVGDYGGSSGPSRIEEFTSAGVYAGNTVSSFGAGNGKTKNPTSLAFDAAGNMFVTDYYNTRVQEFDSGGNYVNKFATSTASYGLAMDSNGYLWVTNFSNNTVDKYSAAGSYISSIGSSGSGNGQFNGADVIAIDSSGNMFVTDDNNFRVQEFDKTGAFIRAFGSHGSGNGQFNGPNYIAVTGR